MNRSVIEALADVMGQMDNVSAGDLHLHSCTVVDATETEVATLRRDSTGQWYVQSVEL